MYTYKNSVDFFCNDLWQALPVPKHSLKIAGIKIYNLSGYDIHFMLTKSEKFTEDTIYDILSDIRYDGITQVKVFNEVWTIEETHNYYPCPL